MIAGEAFEFAGSFAGGRNGMLLIPDALAASGIATNIFARSEGVICSSNFFAEESDASRRHFSRCVFS
jgi:hypothetical protein